MLRIDSHTINGERGQFARLCIQINIDKPLNNCVKIGKMTQTVQYEGLNSLCFACRRIGHRNCLVLIRKLDPSPEGPDSNKQPCTLSSSGTISQEEETCDGEEHGKEKYDDWMAVKRKKRPTWERSHYPSDTLGAMDRIGVTNMLSTPQDMNYDYGKGGKRKVVPVNDVDELRAVTSQPSWPNCKQTSSKGKRSELASTKNGPRKPYQGKKKVLTVVELLTPTDGLAPHGPLTHHLM